MPDLSTDPPTGQSNNVKSRRQFLGLLGGGAATTVGTSGSLDDGAEPVVTMNSNYFDPFGFHVEPGTTVRFEIGTGSHSATAYPERIPSDAEPFDSGILSDGTFEHTFDVVGTYDFYCRPHQSMGMVGRIVVGEPGGPAERTTIPDGDVPDSEVIVEEKTVSPEGTGGDGHGMLESGPGMSHDGGPGWMLLMPLGFVTVFLSLVGGVTYWASRRGTAGAEQVESPLAILEKRYAQGEIDEEEFQRRRDQLRGDG